MHPLVLFTNDSALDTEHVHAHKSYTCSEWLQLYGSTCCVIAHSSEKRNADAR